MLPELESTPLEALPALLALTCRAVAVQVVAVADTDTGVHLLQGGNRHSLNALDIRSAEGCPLWSRERRSR